MQTETQQGLSRKSRAILYKFKNSLQQKRLTLDVLVCNYFGERRQRFTRKQFQSLIRKLDPKLIYGDIDQLFDQLDYSKNNLICYSQFGNAIRSITKDDDPSFLNQLNKKSQIIKNEADKNQFLVLLELKDILLKIEDYLKIIDIFDTEREGYLNKENFRELCHNFGFPQGSKRKELVRTVFGNRQKIRIKNLLKQLDIQDMGKRIVLQDLDIKNNIIIEVPNSEYIKKKSQQTAKLHQSIRPIKTLSQQNIMSIEKIPKQLQHYFNYGSELQISFAQIAKEYITKNATFIDRNNPTYTKAHKWVHLAQGNNRNYLLFQIADSVIHREKNRKGLGQLLEAKDIIQGKLGDCYFLSAVAGIVEKYPQLVYRLFVLQKNPAHIYGVRLFLDGVWKTITLDACFPVDKNGRFCGAQPHHQDCWVLFLEKAWAKAFKSYNNIHSGYNDEGLSAVSGAPCIRFSTKEDGFLKRIQIEINKGSIVTCSTSSDVAQLTQQQQQKLGIFSNHAYTIMKIIPDLQVSQSQKVTLIKVRNPWGRNEWKADWSYHSNKWTRDLKHKLNYIDNPHDGSFFMSFDDFAIYFGHVNSCKVNLGYTNSWIQIKESRYNFANSRFKVKCKGDYFFTIYQQNQRKYQNSFTYSKSKSWLFLGKINGQKLQAIGSNANCSGNNTLQATLQQGQYLIISKVQWKYWQEHAYILTSYGPDHISFQKLPEKGYRYVSSFIQSRCQIIQLKPVFYNGTTIQKRKYFDPKEGYGFIVIKNMDKKALQTQITFNNCQGIEVLQPFSLPLKLYIVPNQTIVCKFIVDPNGYRFNIKQMLTLHKIR